MIPPSQVYDRSLGTVFRADRKWVQNVSVAEMPAVLGLFFSLSPTADCEAITTSSQSKGVQEEGHFSVSPASVADATATSTRSAEQISVGDSEQQLRKAILGGTEGLLAKLEALLNWSVAQFNTILPDLKYG